MKYIIADLIDMKNKLKLTVVTIGFSNIDEIMLTCKSVDDQTHQPYEHIMVISGLNANEKKILESKHVLAFRKFLYDVDNSLYNAMNIGLNVSNGDFLYFLNAGDTLNSSQAIYGMTKYLSSKKCHLFRTHQVWCDDVYVRPSLDKIERLSIFPAHQGCIVPLDRRTPRFNELRLFDADVIWMKECMAMYSPEIHKDVIANFHLGGLSNFPTIRTIRLRYRNQGVKRGSKELVKFIFRKILSDRVYYRFIMYLSGADYLGNQPS